MEEKHQHAYRVFNIANKLSSVQLFKVMDYSAQVSDQ